MWLVLTALAAITTTVIWYVKSPKDKYKLGLLSLSFWGATIMWLVDHVMAYAQEGRQFLETGGDATMLGAAVIVLALFLWMLILLISDPKGIIKKIIHR